MNRIGPYGGRAFETLLLVFNFLGESDVNKNIELKKFFVLFLRSEEKRKDEIQRIDFPFRLMKRQIEFI